MKKVLSLIEHHQTKGEIPFNVRLIEYGESYGLNDAVTHDSYDPLIRFYDGRHADPEGKTVSFTELGQFTGGHYYLSTLLEGIEERDYDRGLYLDKSSDVWKISPDNYKVVLDEYKNYFDNLIIPEAEFKDDFYSWDDLKERFSVITHGGEATSLRSEVFSVLESEIVSMSDKAEYYSELFESNGINRQDLTEIVNEFYKEDWVNRIVEVPDYNINLNKFMKQAVLNEGRNMRKEIDALMREDYPTFVKSFITIETGIEDEDILNEVIGEYLGNDYYTSLLNEELYQKALNLEQSKEIDKVKLISEEIEFE